MMMEGYYYLSDFNSLIQLLAATYSVLILESVFRLSLTRDFYSRIITVEKFKKAIMENEPIDREKQNHAPPLTMNDKDFYIKVITKYIDGRIKNNRIFEKSVYLLSFLFCSFLLLYTGAERYFIIQNYFYALLPVSLLFTLCVLVLLFLSYKQEFNVKKRYIYSSFFVWFGIFFIVILFINKLFANNICPAGLLSKKIIYIFVVLTSFAGFLSLFIIYMREIISFKIYGRNQDAFTDYLDAMGRKKYNII